MVGVDHRPQPRYVGEQFIQADALAYLRDLIAARDLYGVPIPFSFIHASPPCQAFTAYRRTGNVAEYPDLIAPTRELLEASGFPYVIENVEGAPLHDPVLICGSQVDLDVQRHRLFETNWPLAPHPWPCRHKVWAPDRFPGGRSKERTGSSRGLVRGTVEIGSWDIPLETQKAAMRMGWPITLEELSEAIPPAYTELIGHQLMAHLAARLVAAEEPA